MSEEAIGFIALLVALGSGVFLWDLVRRGWLRPRRAMAEALRAASRGKLATLPDLPPRWSPLRGLAAKLRETLLGLQALHLDQEESALRLRSTIASQKQDLQTLFAVSQVITSILRLEPLLEKIVQIILPIVRAKSGVIWLLDQSAIPFCWEVHHCQDHACPAHGARTQRCWAIPGTRCHANMHSPCLEEVSVERKRWDCVNCPVLGQATLSLRVALGLPPDTQEPETLTLGNSLCRAVITEDPHLLVLQIFPQEGGDLRCYRQTTWLSEERPLERPVLVEGDNCLVERIDAPKTRIGLALLTRNQILGVMCLGLDDLHYLSDTEATLLGNIAGLAAVAIENAELFSLVERRSQQVSILLHEAHHRIKNNLQAISGLLTLQLSEHEDPAIRMTILDNLTRLRSIAVVHQLLSQEEVSSVRLLDLSSKIFEMVIQATTEGKAIRYEVKGDDVEVPATKATSIALVLNELAINSIKHGFRGRESGAIQLQCSRRENRVCLEFSDNGVGLPEGFALQTHQNLGLQIAANLVHDDLEGSFEILRAPMPHRGTLARLAFRG
ncbi:MAG: sensor histidine kinase [Nitrospirae bacterium]|nr:sensor histidine kinase [Nitrospirota bacterium]